MSGHLTPLLIIVAMLLAIAAEAAGGWWNDGWRFRTRVERPGPWRGNGERVIETMPDLQALLDRAGIAGEVDPQSVRVVDPMIGRQRPSAVRTEYEPRTRQLREYLTWRGEARAGERGAYHLYFDTTDRGLGAADYRELPPADLVNNGGFERVDGDLPADWAISDEAVASVARFKHTVGERSLRLHIDADTPDDVERTVAISQTVDVSDYAGQHVRFACSLFPERGTFGTPVTCELAQFRADGSRIPEFVVQPRWLTVEMAEGQRVEFAERGRLNPEAVTVNVTVRVRLYARDAWDGTERTAEEKNYTCWIDRISLRPGERWPWPGASGGCFVDGALESAPMNRGIDFRGQRRLVFNGASEGTKTSRSYNPDPRSVHWGPQRGTLEMRVRPHWGTSDDGAWTLFAAKSYMHKIQSQLRVVGGDDPALEFTIADSDGKLHTVRGAVQMERDRWYHVAATWGLPRAHLQVFLDGKPVAAEGPGDEPWPSTMDPHDPDLEPSRGIYRDDCRTMPMQAFVGGDNNWREDRSAEAVIDEVRVSDEVRYAEAFEPPQSEHAIDGATRALFHLEGRPDGIHSGDDRFVGGYLACDEHPLAEDAPVEILRDGQIERKMVTVAPHAPDSLYERNEAHAKLQVLRPQPDLPDPRFIEHRLRTVTRSVSGDERPFNLTVGGDLPPLMAWSRFTRADSAGEATTLIPRWRANDNVVPFSFYTLRDTLAPNAQTDEERALAIFRYALKTTNYYDAHYCEDLGKLHRDRISYTLIRALNIYPFDQCGPLNHTLRYIFIAGGISSNNAPGTHHQFEQGFYDGSLRLFDLSPRQYWLARDNETVISLRELIDDPWLKLRQEGTPNAWLPGMISSATFGSVRKAHSIDVPLRPGERISFGWHNEGRWMALTKDREPIHPAKIPPSYGNGTLIWEATGEGAATELQNATIANGQLTADDPAQDASVTYRVLLPYVLADARVTGTASDEVTVAISTDEEETWQEVWRGEGSLEVDLRGHVMNRYDYALRLTIPAGSDAEVADLQVRSVLIVSPLSLPGELDPGENEMTFVAGPVTEPVTAELAWIERHRSDLGVSLNALSFYLMDDTNHRNLYIARSGEDLAVEVTVEGRAFNGTVTLEGLPEGWLAGPAAAEASTDGRPAAVAFTLRPDGPEGRIEAFEVMLREGDRERRVPAQVLVADAALVAEAEHAKLSGDAQVSEDPAKSAGAQVDIAEEGAMAFTARVPHSGAHALWLRMKLSEGESPWLTLRMDGEERRVRAVSMIGFSDWEPANRASTKVFAHYGEYRGHWNWWRIPRIDLTAGEHTLEIIGEDGQSYDALALLPQTEAVERAAMNLLQTWNFAPWQLPM